MTDQKTKHRHKRRHVAGHVAGHVTRHKHRHSKKFPKVEKSVILSQTDKNLDYENLVIEGGGVLGIAYLGALKELYDDKSIETVTSFAGSSVGSIVALVLAIRCTYDKLEEIILNLNLADFKDRSWIIPDIARFFRNFGFYKGDKLLGFIQDILKEKTGNANITFKEIYEKYQTKLVITGTNLTKGNVSYFCLERTPDMSAALACRISSSVPYFFQSVIYENCYYVDGGVLNNYPIDIFDDPISLKTKKQISNIMHSNNSKNGDTKCTKKINMKTLGLKLISESDINQEKGFMAPITDLKSFSGNLINSMQSQALKIHVNNNDWKRTVGIYTGNLSFLNFNLTNEEKLFLINEGNKAIKLFKKSVILS